MPIVFWIFCYSFYDLFFAKELNFTSLPLILLFYHIFMQYAKRCLNKNFPFINKIWTDERKKKQFCHRTYKNCFVSARRNFHPVSSTQQHHRAPLSVCTDETFSSTLAHSTFAFIHSLIHSFPRWRKRSNKTTLKVKIFNFFKPGN
jgi:threonyl-tRNA synthetase